MNNGSADIGDRATYIEREGPKRDLHEMPGEGNQRCAHYECHIHPDSRTKHAALEIAAQSHDDGVNREAMNDYRAQDRRQSHKQGTKYRDVVRHYLSYSEHRRTWTCNYHGGSPTGIEALGGGPDAILSRASPPAPDTSGRYLTAR
jgi:hypothetical protein